MIDMFTNYQNLSEYYIPNNLSKSFDKPQSYTKLNPIESSKPYELYNAKGELEGYYWNYGSILNLEFTIDGEITVENNAIIYKRTGAAPTSSTAGRLGQKAYNIIDLKSWKCVAVHAFEYVWELESEFIYPSFGQSVYISAEDYLKDKYVTFTIYNFRYEPVYAKTIPASATILVPINEELSKQLVRGVYYCSLEISGSGLKETLFDAQDCKLLVK